MSQHTPGPWNVDVWNYAFPQRKELTIENKDVRIAVLDADMTGDNPFTVPLDVAQANARLMAAAPDLLAALQHVRAAYQAMFDIMPVAWQTFDDICAQAIARATEDSTHA